MKKLILKVIYFSLAFFTRIYIKRTKPFVIWITWNVWKTSCRMIIYNILQKYVYDKIIYSSPKNFNSELWIIFSIFKIEKYRWWIKELIKIFIFIIFQSILSKKEYDIVVLEYWIDHIWDMDFLLKVVKPDIAIFTKLWSIHVENFWTVEKIWEEKFKLLLNAKKKVYLNNNDKYQKIRFDDLKIEKQFFNTKNIDFDYIIEKNLIYSKLKLFWKELKTNLLWIENFTYIELAFFILTDLWIKIDSILDSVTDCLILDNQAWRSTIFEWINNSILIDSTYNAWFESMKQMIDNVRLLKEKLFTNYKLWFVIWDMRELWDFSKYYHEALYLYLKNNAFLITIWQETKKYFPSSVKNFEKSIDAWNYLKDFLINTKEKYIILFKWSQNTIFVEEALKQVLLDKNNESRLPRQDKVWIDIKYKFFNDLK